MFAPAPMTACTQTAVPQPIFALDDVIFWMNQLWQNKASLCQLSDPTHPQHLVPYRWNYGGILAYISPKHFTGADCLWILIIQKGNFQKTRKLSANSRTSLP